MGKRSKQEIGCDNPSFLAPQRPNLAPVRQWHGHRHLAGCSQPTANPLAAKEFTMSITRLALLGALIALPGLALAQGSNNPDFTLQNRGQQVINEIYVSSARTNSWGNDLLGTNTLAPGANFAVVLPAGQCVNDIRVVFANGQASERRGVNTCNLTDVTFP
jgi:hypothetical protein